MSNTHDEKVKKWYDSVRNTLGSNLVSLTFHDASVGSTGLCTGYHAVVRKGAAVIPELTPQGYGRTTALFPITSVKGVTSYDRADLSDALDELAASVPERAEVEFNASLFTEPGSEIWIDDKLAVPTLGCDGTRVGLVYETVMKSTGVPENKNYLLVSVQSDSLQEQAEFHHAIAVQNGLTYGELIADSSDASALPEFGGTTKHQVFGATKRGQTHVSRLMRRAVIAAAERVAERIGLEINVREREYDSLLRKLRPNPTVLNTTNFIGASPSGDEGEELVAIYSETIPVDGPFVYDFGFGMSSAIVAGSVRPVESVRRNMKRARESGVAVGAAFNTFAEEEQQEIRDIYGWVSDDSNIASLLVVKNTDSFETLLNAKRDDWGTEAAFIAPRKVVVPTPHNALV